VIPEERNWSSFSRFFITGVLKVNLSVNKQTSAVRLKEALKYRDSCNERRVSVMGRVETHWEYLHY
jgi:hypothetical protein